MNLLTNVNTAVAVIHRDGDVRDAPGPRFMRYASLHVRLGARAKRGDSQADT